MSRALQVYDATIHIEQGEATVTWNEAAGDWTCFLEMFKFDLDSDCRLA